MTTIDIDNLRYWWTAALDPGASPENEDRIAKEIDHLSEQCIEWILSLSSVPWCSKHNSPWFVLRAEGDPCLVALIGHDKKSCQADDQQVYQIRESS